MPVANSSRGDSLLEQRRMLTEKLVDVCSNLVVDLARHYSADERLHLDEVFLPVGNHRTEIAVLVHARTCGCAGGEAAQRARDAAGEARIDTTRGQEVRQHAGLRQPPHPDRRLTRTT